MEVKDQIDKLGNVIADIQSVVTQQKESYESYREDALKQLADQAASVQEIAQKQQQFETAIAKMAEQSEDSVNSKADEKRAELAAKSFDIFLRKGKGGFDEAKREIAELEKKADMYNTLSDPEGGYITVPAAMGAIIQGRIFETSPIRTLANVVSIGSSRIEFPHERDELEATWDGEKATPADTDTTVFDKIEIVAHSMNARVSVTQEMLDDSAINLPAYINGMVADKFARKEATAFVSGNGVGRPRGFLTYTAGSSTYAFGSIEQVNSGSSSTLTADGLKKLQWSLKEAYQANAAFLMKRATFGDVVSILKDSQNQYMLGLAAAGLDGAYMGQLTILGKPVYFADDMQAVAGAALPVAYGDFRTGYTIVDRVGLRVLPNPYAVQNRVRYEYNKRVGGGVTNFEAIKLQVVAS